MSESEFEAIVSDYFSRLKHALAPLPRSRRNQLLEDLHEHVTMARADLADESELSIREILGHLGPPEEIAAEALEGSRRTAGGGVTAGRSGRAWPRSMRVGRCGAARSRRRRPWSCWRPGRAGPSWPTVVLRWLRSRPTRPTLPLANSDCSPRTDAATSGGPAAVLTSKATEVASGTVDRITLEPMVGPGQVRRDRAGGRRPGHQRSRLRPVPRLPEPRRARDGRHRASRHRLRRHRLPGPGQSSPVHQHRRHLRHAARRCPRRRSRSSAACRSSSAPCPARPATTPHSNSTPPHPGSPPSTTWASAAAPPASSSRKTPARASSSYRPASSPQAQRHT